MILRCPRCHRRVQFFIVQVYTDLRGRRWEVYECDRCKHRVQYAVT